MKTKTTGKKLLALLLTIIMVLGMLPMTAMPALAAGSGYTGSGTKSSPYIVTTYDGMLAVANKTHTSDGEMYIKLGANIYETDDMNNRGIYFGVSAANHKWCVYLDLNGYALSRKPTLTMDTYLIEIGYASELTVTDSSSAKTGLVEFAGRDSSNVFVLGGYSSKLTIENGNFKSYQREDSIFANELIRIITPKTELIVKGGSFESMGGGIIAPAECYIQLYDGNWTVDRDLLTTSSLGVQNHVVEIYGGTYTSSDSTLKMIDLQDGVGNLSGYLRIYGGTFSSGAVNIIACGENVDCGIYGGSFQSTANNFRLLDHEKPVAFWYKNGSNIGFYNSQSGQTPNFSGVVDVYSPVVMDVVSGFDDLMTEENPTIHQDPGNSGVVMTMNQAPDWFKNAGGSSDFTIGSKTTIKFNVNDIIRLDFDGKTMQGMSFTLGNQDLIFDMAGAWARLGSNRIIAPYAKGRNYQEQFHVTATFTPNTVLTGITVTKQPTKTTYVVGERFDPTGMVVKANYSDGTSKTVTNYTTYTNSYYLLEYNDYVTVSYTENYITKTTEVPITVNAASANSVRGSFTASGTATDKTTVALYRSGQSTAAYQTTATGNSGSYSIAGVTAGTYTMKVSKNNHITREYTITVGSSGATKDVKICLIGDVTGDGRVNATDHSRLYAHINNKKPLTDSYLLKCADVTGEGKVNATDHSRLYAHINNKKPLF